MSECALRRLAGVRKERIAKDLFTSSTGLDYKPLPKLCEYEVNNCVSCLQQVQQMQLFHLKIEEPGKILLVQPCEKSLQGIGLFISYVHNIHLRASPLSITPVVCLSRVLP